MFVLLIASVVGFALSEEASTFDSAIVTAEAVVVVGSVEVVVVAVVTVASVEVPAVVVGTSYFGNSGCTRGLPFYAKNSAFLCASGILGTSPLNSGFSYTKDSPLVVSNLVVSLVFGIML